MVNGEDVLQAFNGILSQVRHFCEKMEALELAQQQLQDQLSRMRSKASALEAEEARQKLEIRSLNAKLTRLTSTKASNNQLESDIAELQRNHAEAQEEFKSLREQLYIKTTEEKRAQSELSKNKKQLDAATSKAARHWQKIERLRNELANLKEANKKLKLQLSSSTSATSRRPSRKEKKSRKKPKLIVASGNNDSKAA